MEDWMHIRHFYHFSDRKYRKTRAGTGVLPASETGEKAAGIT